MAEPVRIFLASRNAKKIAEMERILAEHVPDVTVLGLDDVDDYDEPAEDEPTFAGNALLKARAGLAATGLPTVADDSGLCVDVLGGSPGVFSARWAGAHGDDDANLDLLLAQVADVPDDRRGAHFACAAAIARPDGVELVAEGRLTGTLLRARRGDGGFGYDPIFFDPEHGCSAAQLPTELKNRISHRGRALAVLRAKLAAHA